MATILVQVPKRLGLSDDQVTELRRKFESQLVDTMRAEATGALAAAAKEKVVPEVVHPEVIVISEE
jgi:hypothetical protein